MTDPVPAESVEAVAVALCNEQSTGVAAWSGAGEVTRNRFRQSARAALEAGLAALPPERLLAMALTKEQLQTLDAAMVGAPEGQAAFADRLEKRGHLEIAEKARAMVAGKEDLQSKVRAALEIHDAKD